MEIYFTKFLLIVTVFLSQLFGGPGNVKTMDDLQLDPKFSSTTVSINDISFNEANVKFKKTIYKLENIFTDTIYKMVHGNTGVVYSEKESDSKP